MYMERTCDVAEDLSCFVHIVGSVQTRWDTFIFRSQICSQSHLQRQQGTEKSKINARLLYHIIAVLLFLRNLVVSKTP